MGWSIGWMLGVFFLLLCMHFCFWVSGFDSFLVKKVTHSFIEDVADFQGVLGFEFRVILIV